MRRTQTRTDGFTITELSISAGIAAVLLFAASAMVSSASSGQRAVINASRDQSAMRTTLDEIRKAVQMSGWNRMDIAPAPLGHTLELQQVIDHKAGATVWGSVVRPLGTLVPADAALATCGAPALETLNTLGHSVNIENGGVFGSIAEEAMALRASADAESDADAAAALREEANRAYLRKNWTTIFAALETSRDGELHRDLFRILLNPSGHVSAVECVLEDVQGFKAVRLGDSCELRLYMDNGDVTTMLVAPRN